MKRLFGLLVDTAFHEAGKRHMVLDEGDDIPSFEQWRLVEGKWVWCIRKALKISKQISLRVLFRMAYSKVEYCRVIDVLRFSLHTSYDLSLEQAPA